MAQLGWFHAEWDAEFDDVLIFHPGGVIKRKDIWSLQTRMFIQAHEMYATWKLLGVLPHGQGTLQERPVVIEILKLFENARIRLENWEYEQKYGKN